MILVIVILWSSCDTLSAVVPSAEFQGLMIDEGRQGDLHDDDLMGEEDWNDWRVAQTVAVALERQATWHMRMVRTGPFADDRMPTESQLAPFADELDERVGLRDFVNLTYIQTNVSAACLVVAGIYLDRVRALLRIEDDSEFSSCRCTTFPPCALGIQSTCPARRIVVHPSLSV